MGKLTRDDRYQLLEPNQIGEYLVELRERFGVNQPVRFIFTHLFDIEVSETQPIYVIARDEDHQFWPQWFGPPAEELYQCATIEEAIERCQKHYDSLHDRNPGAPGIA